MKWLARRRLANSLWLLLACFLLLLVRNVAEHQLYQTQFITGWVVFIGVLGLTALNLRKKLPILPLVKMTTWVQVHIYLGLFTFVAYAVHAETLVPSGRLDTLLAVLFLLVAVSGVVGLLLSRILPRRLTRHGENLLYERLPGFGAQLRREVEALVMRAASEHRSKSIPAFYQKRLRHFFLKPRNFWAHVFQSRVPMHRLSEQIRSVERYLDNDEKEIMSGIAQCVEAKDGLDYQYAAQSLLKRWLFVHIPLTYGMLLLGVVHVILAYAFDGAA
jgi:hypothetical protein